MATPLQVSCPQCRQPTLYGPDNPWRPFCSARCRGLDLGAWASESYRVPASGSSDTGSSDTGGSGDAAGEPPATGDGTRH
nr:DNA gyrase inhibitor YacG [Pseudorhodoferax sp.]